MTSSSGPYSSFSSSTDFNIGSGLSFDQAVDFGRSLGLDSTTFQELEGIDFSQSFSDPDIAQFFGGTSTEQKQLPPPGPPAAPPNGDYVFDNDGSYIPSQFSKNLFGGNLDVISTLERIEFDPNVDGSLRNAIAYIQPWTRTATSGKTQAGNSPESIPVDNSLNDILSNVWDNLDLFKDADLPSIDPGLLKNYGAGGSLPSFNADKSIWEKSNFNYFDDLNLGSYSDFKGKTFSSGLYTEFLSDGSEKTSDAKLKQDSLKVDNATSTLAPIVPSLGSPVDFEAIGRSMGAALASSGPVFSGNPSGGLLAQVGNLARAFGVISSSGIDRDLSSSQPKSSSLSRQPIGPSSGKWQFLFNPSQLTLSVGPNFKAAETWGVGDEPNAGQPLHWTSYKNPELKFSKVLLNGYVFGRRVEELEQGLIKLFMESPTNDAKHGPRVLEFVWGKKTFGPCVIRDVRINQKMWDEGLLVNAEVDFTLVRVPEWTINDGYVSTYDPSAQNTITSPQSGTSAPGGGGNVGIGSSSPNSSDQTQPPTPPARRSPGEILGLPEVKYAYTQSECDSGRYTAKNFSTLAKDPRLTPNPAANVFGSSDAAANIAVNKYATIYNSFATVINTLPGLDPPCKAKCSYVGRGAQTPNTLIGCARSCSQQIAGLLNNRYSGKNKCPNPTLLAG